jgi:hypothetical protein
MSKAVEMTEFSSIKDTDLETGSALDEGYEAIAPANSPAVLAWQNLTIVTKVKKSGAKPKVLLNNLTGTITGGVWAIMGSSGSGIYTFCTSSNYFLVIYRSYSTVLR